MVYIWVVSYNNEMWASGEWFIFVELNDQEFVTGEDLISE